MFNKKIFIFVIPVFCLFFGFYMLNFSSSTKKGVVVHVNSGESLDSLSKDLKKEGVISNEFIFKSIVKMIETKGVVEGDYQFKKGVSVFKIAWQITRGVHNIKQIKITFREGITNEGMSDILKNRIENFNEKEFIDLTKSKQGYLFPDTYFFYPLDTNEEIINKLESNFHKKTDSLKLNGKSLEEIIIMASILEGEASGGDDVGIISGILWKRINKGMRLQVDAAPTTYEEKGLPSSPLNNPGLSFIKAAINPVESDYWYYLHDKDGNAHFAKTYEEHKLNIKKYLK